MRVKRDSGEFKIEGTRGNSAKATDPGRRLEMAQDKAPRCAWKLQRKLFAAEGDQNGPRVSR